MCAWRTQNTQKYGLTVALNGYITVRVYRDGVIMIVQFTVFSSCFHFQDEDSKPSINCWKLNASHTDITIEFSAQVLKPKCKALSGKSLAFLAIFYFNITNQILTKLLTSFITLIIALPLFPDLGRWCITCVRFFVHPMCQLYDDTN